MNKTLMYFHEWLLARDLRDSQEEISERNKKTLIRVSWVSIGITLLNIVVQSIPHILYGVILNILVLVFQIIAAAILLWYHRSNKPALRNATSLLYGYEAIMLLCGLSCSTILNSGTNAISYIIFSSIFPIIILDIPWRILCFKFSWDVLFILFALLFKNRDIFFTDLVNFLLCATCSLICLVVVISSRLDEIRNHRKAVEADRTDDLTGLWNHRYFSQCAAQIVKSENNSFCIVYYDFNNIRDFNHVYGFSEGDRLLAEFARMLKKNYPDRLCGRFGEDHFVVLAKADEWKTAGLSLTMDLDKYIYQRFDRHIQSNIKNRSLIDRSDTKEAATMPLSIRCGICGIPDSHGVDDACDKARIACHYRIHDNPAEYRIYDESLAESTQSEAYVLRHIDEALQMNHIKVYYQPIARATTDQVCSEEALARWDDPVYGLMPPSRFIPVLEEHGLLYKIDFYVLEQVLRDFRTKAKAGISCVPVSINLSRNDFYGRDIVDEICRRVDAAECPHHMIDIEITESAYASDTGVILHAMNRFHEAGFRLWMDDFGSGYSSLNLLKDSKFDLIKLDMRFMQNFDKKTEVIVGSVISMANRMGIDTLAEGVETEEQRNALRYLGCSRLQGYYYSRPLTLDKVIGLVTQSHRFPFEKHDRAAYYDQISRVNLSDPLAYYYDPIVSGLTDSLPAAISEWDDAESTLLILRANLAFKQAQKNLSDIRYDFSRIGTTDEYKYTPMPETQKAVRECIRTNAWVVRQIRMKDAVFALYMHEVGFNSIDNANAVLFVVIPSRV